MGDRTAVPDVVADLFRGRRMVLSIQCGEGGFLGRLAEMGVPGVGIDTAEQAILTCRSRQLASWVGTWRVLQNHPQKFDGILLPLDRLDEDWHETAGAMLQAIHEGLLPGGLLLVHGCDQPAEWLADRAPPGLDPRGGTAGILAFTRAPAPPVEARDDLGIRVGPYADAFVGCENVLELGCGRGRFLDNLRVRDVPCSGIEADREMARVCIERDLPVEHGGAELLRDRPERHDGVFFGNLFDPIDLAAARQLAQAGIHTLRAGGRLLVRCRRGAHAADAIQELLEGLGLVDVRASEVPGDLRDFLVLGRRPDGLRSAPPDAVPLVYTRDREIDLPLRSIHDLERFERKVYSQCGDDGVLDAIFELVGTTNRYYVEFGCGDGIQCNTTYLRRQGWQGLLMDGMEDCAAEDAIIHKEWITPQNIDELFRKHHVPGAFDLLSLDLDGNDYWVLEALSYRPRVIVAEYNGNLPPDHSLTIAMDPNHTWDGGDYYGASLLALTKIARTKGYELVYCNAAGVNAYFVQRELMGGAIPRRVADIYRPANYWYRGGRQLPDLSRAMIDPDA